MSSGCSRRPTLRKSEETVYLLRQLVLNREAELIDASRRINDLDSFARWAGGILENMWVSYSLTPEKDELKKLVDQYHKLFPSVSDELEF